MTYTVWKFDLPITDRPSVRMPPAARIVHIAHQPGQPEDVIQVWAEADDSAEQRDRDFIIAGTGSPVDPAWMHLGTAVTPLGMVWHVYEDCPF